MSMLESIHQRRSYYQLVKELPVDAIKIKETVQQATELVPDAFNMKSARVVLAMNSKHDELWDAIYTAFGGKVAREKIDSFTEKYFTLRAFRLILTTDILHRLINLHTTRGHFP